MRKTRQKAEEKELGLGRAQKPSIDLEGEEHSVKGKKYSWWNILCRTRGEAGDSKAIWPQCASKTNGNGAP